MIFRHMNRHGAGRAGPQRLRPRLGSWLMRRISEAKERLKQRHSPLPTLPPSLRDGPAIPGVPTADPETTQAGSTEPTRAIDRASLVADINALRQDVARVRRSLESQDPQFSQAFERESEERQAASLQKPRNGQAFRPKATPLYPPA